MHRAVAAFVAVPLAVVLAAGALVAVPRTARAADDPSNIPGTPLPDSPVAGLLGGDAIDRVYSIEIPRQNVLFLSLTGDPGTDFDLYLFDGTALTVYGTQGLVAKSTSNGSTESITYAAPAGGRFFVNISSFSTALGYYTLRWSIRPDTTAPTVSLALDGGIPATSDPTVTVSVIATDDLSGLDAMQVSSDGNVWAEWQPYAPAFLWTFPPPDGTKQLWVRVRDRQGNVSRAATASIVLDSNPPGIAARVPEPGGTLRANGGVVRITFTEPIQPASWLSGGVVVQDRDSVGIFGTYAYDAATRTGSFTPGIPLQAGALYVVTLGAVRDLAGNLVEASGEWTFTAVIAPTIAVAVAPRTAMIGGSVTITGQTDSAPGGSFTLERSVAGGAWATVEPLIPDAAGVMSAAAVVRANTTFRIHYAGSQFSAESMSGSARVLVRRVVRLEGPQSNVTRVGYARTTITLVALLTPAAPAVKVSATVYQYVPASRAYVRVATVSAQSAGGRARIAWRPGTAGTYRVVLSTPGTVGFAPGISSGYRWEIR
jgi:hypothetical protein